MPPESTSPPPPQCYGQLEKVFPMSQEGMREVRDLCWNCALRVDCLRQAMADPQQHRAVSEERAARDSAPVGGVAGFLQRWSRLKRESQER